MVHGNKAENESKVLALLWSLIEHFEVTKNGVDDLHSVRESVVNWLQIHTVPPGQSESPFDIPNNLAEIVGNGKVLNAVLHSVLPDEHPPHGERDTGNAAADLTTALARLHELLGLDKLFDHTFLDERAVLHFLVHLKAKMGVLFPSTLLADSPDPQPASAEVKLQELALAKEQKERDDAALQVKICFVLLFRHMTLSSPSVTM